MSATSLAAVLETLPDTPPRLVREPNGADPAQSPSDTRTRAASRPARPAPRSLRDLLADPALLEPPVALIPNLAWRGRVTLLSAPAKAGKSTVQGQGAAALSAGRAVLGGETTAGAVLWYAIDEPLADAARRLHTFGANPDACFIVEDRPSADEMASEILATNAALVVVDTLTELWSGLIESERDAQEVARFVRPYVGITRTLNVALQLIHHTTKSGEQYRGSGQLAAAVDNVLTLRQPSMRWQPDRPKGRTTDEDDESDDGMTTDDGRRRLEGKGRAGVRVDLRLQFDGVGYVIDDRTAPLRTRVLRALQLEPLSGSALAKRVGGRKQSVLLELKALEADGYVGETGGLHMLTHDGKDLLAQAAK